ncbi:MAG: LicD family protein [Erysipelotrichaceae bacterium]
MNKVQITNTEQIDLKETQSIMVEILFKVHDICEKHNIEYYVIYGTLLGAIRHNGFIPWDDDIDIRMSRADFNKFMSVAQEELGDEYFVQTPNTDHKFDILHVPYKIRNNNSTLIELVNKNYNQGIFIDVFVADYMGSDESVALALKKKTRLLASMKMSFDLSNVHGITKVIRFTLLCIFRLVPTRFIHNYIVKQAQVLLKNDKTNSTKMMDGLEYVDSDVWNVSDIFPLKKHLFEGKEIYVPNNYDTILKHNFGNYMELPKESDRIPHGIFYSNKKCY